MATKSVSPGGALLRASRMFSLPAPIPPPVNESASIYFHSDTATIAHPTHQIITTLPSARKQGDWGLKRPLPLKSTTKSSNPMLRVKAIDTIEQITDYTSATDHGITLRKFQELAMPVTARRPAGVDTTSATEDTSKANLPQTSVFEDELDVTDIPLEKRAQAIDTRWRFTGPWLAGITQGDFKRWLAKTVRPKRAEFREFLKKKIASEMHAKAAAQALDKAEEQPAKIDPSSITEEQVINYLRKLRHEPQALYDMVGQFLDLAPLQPPTASQLDSMRPDSKLQLRVFKNPYAESGPPKTHPSAGISYLRTSMYMENHPIYGPQKQHAPVQARILRPRRVAQSAPAKLGMAGFVVSSSLGDTSANSKNQSFYDRFDPSIEGGAKVWVQPQRAAVDSNGRVMITVDGASAEAALVAQELLGNASVLGKERAVPAEKKEKTADEIRQKYRLRDTPPAMSSAQDYGLTQ